MPSPSCSAWPQVESLLQADVARLVGPRPRDQGERGEDVAERRADVGFEQRRQIGGRRRCRHTDETQVGCVGGGVLAGEQRGVAPLGLAEHDETPAGMDQVVDRNARPVVERLAEMCIQDPTQIAALFPEAAILSTRFLARPPWKSEPWQSIIAANTPGQRPANAPILILQGEADPLVLPKVQAAFVRRLCRSTDTVEYRTLRGVGHLDAGHAAGDDVAAWAVDRMAAKQPTSTCAS